MDPVERTVQLVLLAGIGVSVALMAAGLALGLARGAGLPSGVAAMTELPVGLVRLRPSAYISAGLVVLIATPFVRVAGSLVAFAVQKDRRYVMVTAAVFAVMCLSVLLGKA
jgi:uncharacterized membrane protein